MTNRSEVTALIKELHEAAAKYYQSMDTSPLEDDEFDAKTDLLITFSEDPDLEDLFAEGTPGWKLIGNDVSLGSTVTASEIITHRTPMLSLGKATNEQELHIFITRARKAGAKDFTLQAKLDGFALSVTYENGKITTLATRGTGTHGEDLKYLLSDPNLTIKGLPLTITSFALTEVRGELFFTADQFKNADAARFSLTGEHFKNSRNSVVGLMKKAKLGVDYPVEFTFSTYSVLIDNKPELLETVAQDAFITVDTLTKNEDPTLQLTNFQNDQELFAAVEAFGKARTTFSIPTDGVVIKPSNEAEMMTKMGVTSHHPSSQIAYKYPGETADTEVIDITVTVGKTGKLTPCAKVKPVLVAGTLIQNITMNNYNWVAIMDVRIGSLVRVHRANDVIPEIKHVLLNPTNTTPITTPMTCPVCTTRLVYDKTDNIYPPKTLNCPNLECPSRDFFALKTAVSKNFLDIDGLSEVSLTWLNETGRVNDISDLYTLTLTELADSQLGLSKDGNPRRLGEKRAQNILNHIEASKTLPLYRLLISLNIAGLGPTTAKLLIKNFTTLENIQTLTVNDIEPIEGLSTITATKIVTGLAYRKPLITKLQSYGVTFAPDTTTAPTAQTRSLADISFAISGEVPPTFPNRTAWIDYIESQGGTFHSSPKATTTYIIGDPTAISSKTTKAITLGLTFLTPEEFTQKFVK